MRFPSRLWRAAAGLGVLLAAREARADERLKLDVVVEGRLVTTPTKASFLDGGLGKTRYGHEPRRVEASVSQAVVVGRFEPRVDLSINAQLNAYVSHDFGRRLDVVEAFARYTPAITDAVSLDLKAGLFFPGISLENSEPGWLSPYTSTFSAINSWVGEEVRSLGVEGGPSVLAGETRAQVFGAATRKNDPTGTLLAWRGFALHDRVSGLADRLPLPPLRSFDRPELFPDQPLYVEPMREVDGRWTWSTGLRITNPRYRVRALYQPRTANPGAFDGHQYAWRTGYVAVGVSRSLGPFEVLAQALDGETRMGLLPSGRNAVIAGFRSGFLLGTWASASRRHRTTLRFDTFRVTDRDDFKTQDANAETGSAWTFAYRIQPAPHHAFTLEVVRVDSLRDNRRDLGLDPRAIEISGSLSWRLSF